MLSAAKILNNGHSITAVRPVELSVTHTSISKSSSVNVNQITSFVDTESESFYRIDPTYGPKTYNITDKVLPLSQPLSDLSSKFEFTI